MPSGDGAETGCCSREHPDLRCQLTQQPGTAVRACPRTGDMTNDLAAKRVLAKQGRQVTSCNNGIACVSLVGGWSYQYLWTGGAPRCSYCDISGLARGRFDAWRTEDMAQAAGMSRGALPRNYTKRRGFGPGHLLDQSRCNYAQIGVSAVTPKPVIAPHFVESKIKYYAKGMQR